MARKIKRFFAFMFFSLLSTFIGGKRDILTVSKDGTTVSENKSVLPLTIGNTAEASGWTCYDK